MFGYIYETTNLINGKKYIGQHKASKFDKNYYGSGKILKQALLKEGKENFKVILIEECNNQEELNEREIYWINYYNTVKDKNYYNIGAGGSSWNNSFNSRPKEERSRIISEANKKRFQDPKERYKCGNGMRGRKLTPQQCKNISISHLGEKHWLYGKHSSKESIEKNRQSHLGKKLSEDTKNKIGKSNKGKHNRKHTKEQRALISKRTKEAVKKYCEEHPDFSFASLKDKIAINDGNHRIYINKEELNMYLEKGFKLGYPKRKEVI